MSNALAFELRLYVAGQAAKSVGACANLTGMCEGVKAAVLNLQGRVFMEPLDCPFTRADEEVAALRAETPIIVVDIHAEATSEKQALGWYLDGRVSAVIGTHTHVPTADERVLHQGDGLHHGRGHGRPAATPSSASSATRRSRGS